MYKPSFSENNNSSYLSKHQQKIPNAYKFIKKKLKQNFTDLYSKYSERRDQNYIISTFQSSGSQYSIVYSNTLNFNVAGKQPQYYIAIYVRLYL